MRTFFKLDKPTCEGDSKEDGKGEIPGLDLVNDIQAALVERDEDAEEEDKKNDDGK